MTGMRLIGTGLIVALIAARSMAGEEGKPPTRTINVTGTATVKTVPDEVTLSIGVSNTNPALETAKKEVDAAIKKVMAVVKEMQIEARDVQTDRLSMHPQLRYDDDDDAKPPVFVGYCVSNQVCIILRDTAKCEELITSLFAAGVNTVDDVSFQTSKLREYRDQARLMAVKLAKEKAALIADEFGMKVGKPITIRETAYSPYAAMMPNRTAQVQQSMAFDDRLRAGGPSDENRTVALGQISVTATIEVTFELE
jgi:uncharacterized protein